MRAQQIARGLTVGSYLWACLIDFASTLALLNLGYGEHNALYAILGAAGFWLLYLAVSAGLLIGVLVLSETKWWWAYLVLWIPAVGHTICAVHNITLFLY